MEKLEIDKIITNLLSLAEDFADAKVSRFSAESYCGDAETREKMKNGAISYLIDTRDELETELRRLIK